MDLTILGYWGGYPTKDVGTTSYLIESNGFKLLLDVGSNSLLTLEHHLDPLDLDAVLLSHYHHDHIADLGVLQFTRLLKRDKDGKKAPLLPIYGHHYDEINFKRLTHENVSKGCAFTKMENPFDIGPFKIEYLKTLHPVECYAFRIEERNTGKVFVFTADSGFKKDFISFAKGAHLLMGDANLFEGDENHPIHMTSKEIGSIGKEARVKRIVLTHLPQEGSLKKLKKEAIKYAGTIPVELAEKNKTIKI